MTAIPNDRMAELSQRFTELEPELKDSSEKEALSILHGMIQESRQLLNRLGKELLPTIAQQVLGAGIGQDLADGEIEAIDETTSSSGRTPAERTHLVRFCRAVAPPCTMWVVTSRRMALMPSGSLTPSWPSTVKSRGSTCRTSRLEGMVTARATSVARSMSSRVIVAQRARSWARCARL